jgi:hypothetical protein
MSTGIPVFAMKNVRNLRNETRAAETELPAREGARNLGIPFGSIRHRLLKRLMCYGGPLPAMDLEEPPIGVRTRCDLKRAPLGKRTLLIAS